jgi:hypothetical protein
MTDFPGEGVFSSARSNHGADEIRARAREKARVNRRAKRFDFMRERLAEGSP